MAATVACKQIINDTKYISFTGRVDCHGDAAVRCGAHCPMDYILGPGLRKKPLDAAIG